MSEPMYGPPPGDPEPGQWPDFRRPERPAASAYPPFDIYRPEAPVEPQAYPPTSVLPALQPVDFPPPGPFDQPVGQPGEWWAAGPWQERPRRPASHVTGAALATVFLSFPLGAVALYHALRVDERFDAGDLAGAQRASERASVWLVWAVAMGLAWLALVLLFFLTRR